MDLSNGWYVKNDCEIWLYNSIVATAIKACYAEYIVKHLNNFNELNNLEAFLNIVCTSRLEKVDNTNES